MQDTLARCIKNFAELSTKNTTEAKTTKQAVNAKMTFSNAQPGSWYAEKADLASRNYTVANVSKRLENECKKQTGKFTVCQFKHCTVTEEHYKLLMCFKAGQCTKAEIFAVHATEGLLDSTKEFPDLTKGFTFESPHSSLLSSPTIFTNPKALRDSTEALVELYRLDELRMKNHDDSNTGGDDILAHIVEQYQRDGGILRKPNPTDEAWAIEFERPGSDIMQRTGIDTRFYRVDDIGHHTTEALDSSDGHVNVLPLKFVHDEGDSWIVMLCFGDKDGCLAEVNAIDMATGGLLMIDDDKDFPRLDEGAFVPIFPPGQLLRSKNKFVDAESLGEKIQNTAKYLMDALNVVEKMEDSRIGSK